MNAIQQKCRPKHQVLVLKCYPRTTKGAVDVKPNSSELSYLLFYATSRRSKIQKVGAFLEKKTASDVWRQRIGNVQVTLQILAALIEKAPKDLPLFAQNVLKILELVLRSNDITMVEASLPTFETFCEHHDASSLFADQTYVRQYEDIVRSYAAFASTRQTPGKGTPSKPVALRWRNAGLEAIKSVADSDASSSVAGSQLDTIVPMILENLWSDNESFLEVLIHRTQVEEKGDAGSLTRRRTSISTVKTAETAGDTNPLALSGSAADADRVAEEDTGLLAMQCLKKIFVVPNRAQIHTATTALLKFIQELVQQKEVVMQTNPKTGRDSGWALKIYGLAAKWAPVQDRYVILINVMDTLSQTQPTDENVQDQVVLVSLMSSLLRSDVNLIGLSVMDVLLGLLQHMKKVLKYSSGRTSQGGPAESSTQDQLTSQHADLVTRILQCIGDLATHVYYADQISDMISAILLRLKPHSPVANPISPVEATDATPVPPGTSNGQLSEDQQLDNFFSLDIAKTAALKAIKALLLVANPKANMAENASLSRNKVPIQVWEGTHWLFRDPDGHVRKAYADVLVTWLDRETTKANRIARDENAARPTRGSNRDLPPPAAMARRAVSSASNRERPVKIPRSFFLPLIHLTIYDHALESIEYETDAVLCHVLLTKLVNNLGVNAVRYGLPMIFRLQEDIQEAETPLAKVRLGSLCHGYFWAVSEQFNFEASVAGRAILTEVSRRRSKGFWVEGVNVPPPMVELVGTPGVARPQPKLPAAEVETEALLPFDDRLAMVEYIGIDYRESAISPPASPSASPGRNFVHPILGSTLSTIPPAETDQELPTKFREDLLADWNHESAMLAIQQASKSASLSGSKTGTTHTKGRLAVRPLANGNGASPGASQRSLRPTSNAGPGTGPISGLRKSSAPSGVSGRSGSSHGFVASVDQLKSVLSGDAQQRPVTMHTVRDDDSSESMASYDFTPSELSFNPGEGGETGLARTRSKSRERKASGDNGGPLTSNPTEGSGSDEENVPPVPPLPSSIMGNIAVPTPLQRSLSSVSTRDYAIKPAKRNLKSRGGESVLSSALDEEASPSLDLQSLLKGIDSKSKLHTMGNLTKPPY